MDLSNINALCLGAERVTFHTKQNKKIQVGWCGSISCYLGDNIHTLITPKLALLERQFKQWSVIQMKKYVYLHTYILICFMLVVREYLYQTKCIRIQFI